MARLATLTTRSKADIPSRGKWLLAVFVSWTLPIGLIFTMFPPDSHDLLRVALRIQLDVIPIILIIFLALSCVSLANLWGPFTGGPGTLADLFRNAGAVPEVITTLTCLTVLLVIVSTFLYSSYFIFRYNVPTWERRGPRSHIVYVNGVIAALEVIFSVTIIRLLNSVPETVFQRSSIGTTFYVPPSIVLVHGGSTFLGIGLMIAGPSAFRLPTTYEPVSWSPDNASYPTVTQVEPEFQDIPQVPENQRLATLYLAQHQQRRQLMRETKRKFMSKAAGYDQPRQVLADSPESAELGRNTGTEATKFDDGTAYWAKYDRPFYSLHIRDWSGVLFLINCPIQTCRFIRHIQWNRQDCTSFCYLDFFTPFLGVPVFVVLQIVLRRRIDLQRKLWSHGPSVRALLVIYYFSTLAIYIAHIVSIGVGLPFESDFLNHEGKIALACCISFLLLVLCLVGGCWAKSLYRRDLEYNDEYMFVPPIEIIDARE